jgi:hypothetical protein
MCTHPTHASIGTLSVHSHLGRQILRPFAVETIRNKVQHIPSVYLLIWSTMEPAGYEVMDGQHTMKLQKTLFHFLNSVYINLFYPLFVHNCIPVIQISTVWAQMLCMIDGSCVRLICQATSVQRCFVRVWWQPSLNQRTERPLYAAQVCCEKSKMYKAPHNSVSPNGNKSTCDTVGYMDSAETAISKGQFCAGNCKDPEHDAAYLHF